MSESTLRNISTVLFLLSSLHIYSCESDLAKFGLEKNAQQNSLGNCIVTIARKTFYRTTLTMIYEKGSFIKSRSGIHRALFSIGIGIQHVLVTHLTENEEHVCTIAYGGNFLLAIRNHTQIEVIFRKFRECKSWSAESKVIALVPFYRNEGFVNRAALINTVMNLHLVNSIAMIEHELTEDRYDIVSGYAYSRGECDSSNHSYIVTLDSCLFGVLDHGNVEIFPKKAQLNGCSLRIGTVIQYPYIQARKEGEGGNATDVIVGGLEVLFMKEMARILNFSAVYVLNDTNEEWGDVYPNGTLTGLFKTLLERRADLVMCSLSASVTRNQRFIGLHPLFFTSHTYCVPYSHQLPVWLKMINVIHFSVIITILLLVVIMAFIVRKLFWISSIADKFNRCNTNHDNRITTHQDDVCYYRDPLLIWLLLISTMLTISVRRFPRNGRVRSIFALWFLLSINIDTGFRTHFMASLSRDDHEPQIQTYEEMIEKNYIIYLPEFQFNNFKVTENPRLRRLWRRCYNVTWCLDQVAYGHNSAMSISSTYAESVMHRYVPQGYEHPIIYCLPNVTVTLPAQIFTMRGFALTQSFNEAIQVLSSGGFIDLWRRNSFPVPQISVYVALADGQEDIRLTLEHLQGLFMVISFLYALAMVVFFSELWYFRLKSRKS